MTWTLTDQMLIDHDALFNTDEFGEAAVYTPPDGGASTPVTVVTAPLEEDADVRRDARRLAMTAFVPMAELTPAYRGTLTIGAEVWTIAAAPSPYGDDWRLDLEQDPRLRLSQ